MVDNSTKEKDYTKLIHHFDSLQESYNEELYNNKSSKKDNSLPYISQYTGLQKGKVYDVEYRDEQIKLFVKTKHDTYEFLLDTCNKYNENVTFIKFMLHYNIDFKYPSELFGKEILLKKELNEWNIYIPKQINIKYHIKNYIDIFLRSFGYHNFNNYKYKYELITGLFVLTSVSITFSTILFYVLQELTTFTISMNIFIYLIILFPFISSILYRITKLK